MGAYPATGEKQRISHADGLNCPEIILVLDLGDVPWNIYLGRAGLGAGCKGIIFLVEFEKLFSHALDFNDVLWACFLAGSAPHALVVIHSWVTVFTHGDSSEFTGLDTISKSYASNVAIPFPSEHNGHGFAGGYTHIMVLVRGPVSTFAHVVGLMGFSCSRIYPHDGSDLGNGICV